MSKTSGRQARKRRQELRGLRWEALNAVPYELHAAVVRELERVSAVLADLIEEQKGAAVPAREVVAWVKNPEDVRAVFDASADFYDCPECDVSRSSAHLRTCAIARAWYRTGHHHHLSDLKNAHHEALVENNRRTVGKRVTPQDLAGEFPPPVRLNNGSVINRDPNLFNVEASSYDLWRSQSVEQRQLTARDIARHFQPMTPLIRDFDPGDPYDGAQRDALGRRAASDARGMEVVEAEARRWNRDDAFHLSAYHMRTRQD